MKLVIVESPTKAKTISKFLGRTYAVKSSYGHIRDLPKKEMGIDIQNDFQPRYIIPLKSRKIASDLKKTAQKADEIILATDEDREGEAIAWHLAQALELKISDSQFSISSPKADQPLAGKKIPKVSRIVFHEITKSAIEKALKNPRNIDINLVDAQQARRILDRLVGYELSPFLWKKIKKGLSAGRVQSLTLRLIAEREREIEKFKPEEYWTISAKFKKAGNGDKDNLDANLIQQNGKKIETILDLKLFAGSYKIKKTTIADEKSAQEIVADLEKYQHQIINIEEKEIWRNPPPPFTTSTLQQAAINSLGFSAKQTMVIAQQLYEKGFITYMRTDSVNLSLESMLSAKKTIEKLFGKEYVLKDPRFYKTKSKGAQEAHEAIRPTYPEKTPQQLEAYLDKNQCRLYKLIWNRMIACQMESAVLNSVNIDIEASERQSENKYLLRAHGLTVKFDGFLKVYPNKSNASENMLPPLKINELLDLIEAVPTQKFTSPPPRYSEATLVKVLEENGIGRPSTYAPTISTIIDRKYVDKNEEKRLYPLEIGLLVNDLLVQHFSEIVNINFTARIEEDLDEIAEGKKQWVPVVREFYNPFHENLKNKNEEVKKEDVLEKLDKKCPECGGDLLVRFGRFGKFIACANFPQCKYTEKTEEEKKVEKENTGEKCEKCGSPMVVKYGKYGAFLGCSNYPQCKNIKRIENKIGIKCPKCKKGEIVELKSKNKRLFYGCNQYPKCNFALWNKPNGEKCPQCGSLLVFAAKGKIKCSNKECRYEKS